MKAKNLVDWREKVLRQSNFVCQNCGATSRLVAHHIKSQYTHLELKLTVENGIALCRGCHIKNKEFVLRLFYPTSYNGYIPQFLTHEEIEAKQRLKAELATIPRQFRDSYQSRLYKITESGEEYWVTLPSNWLDRELRRLGMTVKEFVNHFRVMWLYNGFEGAWAKFVPKE